MDWVRLRHRRFHSSYLLGWLAAGLLGGLWLGRELVIANNAVWIFVALVCMLGAFHSRRWWAIVVVVLAGLMLGSVRGAEEQERYSQYEGIIGRSVELQGTMSGDAQQTKNGQHRVTLSHISIEGQSYVGEVFVTIYGKADMKRGDQVTIRGVVDEGFASYAATVRNGRVLSVTRGQDFIRDIREKFAATIREMIKEPMASLGLGFVVGQRSTLPDELDEQLKIVGLTHIVVASGYNLTILVRFMMRILSRHSRYLALVGSLTMVTAFVLFSGMSPSMNRAVVVTVLSLLAWYVGRRFQPVLLIGYVAAGTALINPMYVWSDLGWYLSFFAFAGILVMAPLLLKALYRKRSPSSFEQLVFETISAEMAALPLIMLSFGVVPTFGLVANVLVAPFIPAAMALVAAAGIVGMVSTGAGMVIALPATLLIAYMVAVVEWLSSLPIAQYAFDAGLSSIVLWYVSLVAVGAILHWRLNYDFSRRDTQLEV